MGVARVYKSTGDMLAAAELAGYRKKLDSEGEEEPEADDLGRLSNRKYYCDDHHHQDRKKGAAYVDDDDELARRTPLLLSRHKQRKRSRTLVDEESYKFIGCAQPEVEAEDEEAGVGQGRCRPHWRSTGDFLALNLQQQQQQQHLETETEAEKVQDGEYDNGFDKRPADRASSRMLAHRSHEYSLDQDKFRAQFSTDARCVAKSKQQQRRPLSPSIMVATATKRIGTGKWRANRIVRRRKGTAQAADRQCSSLSLSSPALAQRQSVFERDDEPPSPPPKAETETQQQQQQQQQQQVNSGDRAAAQQHQPRPQMIGAGELEKNGGSRAFDVDARGTMAAPMDQNYCREHRPAHCFVDVAHLQQSHRRIPANPSQLLTNERFTTTTTTIGCCFDKTKNLIRQDNSNRLAPDYDQIQQHDNGAAGYRLPLGRGVGVGVGAESGSPVHGDGRSGSPTGCGQAWGSPGSNELGGAQSADASRSPPVVVMLPNSRLSNQVAEEAEERQPDNKSSTDYAPTRWQQQVSSTATAAAAAAPAAVANQLAKGNNHSSIERSRRQQQQPLKPAVASSGTDGQVVVGPKATRTRDRLAGGSFSFVDYPNKISSENCGLASSMGSRCESWRHALQPNKSGTYKVAKSQLHFQQQVAPISGTDQIVAATPTVETTIDESQQETRTATGNQGRPLQAQQSIFIHSNGGGGRAQSVMATTRHSRPGRSPVSLQRLTNARLARHRLKIQQQRQDQLAQLALRERQQLRQPPLNSHNYYHQHQHQHPNHHLDQHPPGPPNARQDQTSGSFLASGLIDRFTPADGRHTNQTTFSIQRYNRLPGETSAREQQSVIIPNTTRTIEICDNQLACSSSSSGGSESSSGTSQNQYHRNHTNQPGNQRLSGNVIVYKSINMLRNTSLDCNNTYGRTHISGVSGSDGRRSYGRHELVESDEIESDPDTSTISSEGSTLDLNKPFCKVCHTGSTKHGDKLISPCRCSGTMQYIHCGCLLKWLEISNRSNEKPMSCELCAHEYTWHKKFNYRQMRLPKCSMKDAFLHIIFVAAMGVMLFSAIAPMLQSKSHETLPPSLGLRAQPASSTAGDRSISSRQKISPPSSGNSYTTTTSSHRSKHSTGHLAQDEKFMLLCAASFFMSFFLAIYVQTKARDTLYGLVVKFLTMNQTYYITEYDHGQLNSNNNNNGGQNTNNNGGGKQQYVEDGLQGIDRKHSGQKS